MPDADAPGGMQTKSTEHSFGTKAKECQMLVSQTGQSKPLHISAHKASRLGFGTERTRQPWGLLGTCRDMSDIMRDVTASQSML